MTQQAAELAGQGVGAASLPSLLRSHAAERPWAPAIVTTLAPPTSYGALAERCAAMGRLLRQAGIGRDGRIAILLPNGGALASALVSLLSHAIAVPLDPRLTDAELGELCARMRLDAMLSDGSSRLPPGRLARRIALAEGGERLELCVYGSPRGPAEDRAETPDSLAMILRTSGTTAQPKLVPLTHGNIVARAKRLQCWLGLTAEDRALCVAPLHYAHGLETAIFAPLAVGGSLACPPPSDQGGSAGHVLDWLADLEPTYYSAGPTFHRMLLDRAQAHGGKPQHSLRLIQSGGAPLPERERADLEAAFGVPVLDAYGLSETGQLAANGWTPTQRRPGTVGRPYDGTVALRGEDGTLLELGVAGTGARGEIVARGANVTPGYLDDSGRLLPLLVDGWFRTGDLGTVDADGFLIMAGRLKDIVNRGGEKIAPAEIDQALLRHPDVAEAAAFAVPHARLGEDLAAAVVLRAGAAATPLQLRRYLSERLVPFKVPRRIHLVPQLPKGATGKVSRAALTQQFSERPRQDHGGTTSALEFEVVALWARLLKLDSVDPTDDFFELGGDSLLAVEMRLELERLIGREVPESLLFEAATARQLVNAIVAEDGGAYSALLPLRTEGYRRPFFFFDGDLSGGGYYMRRIAALLEPDRPLWLLRPFELTSGRLPTIEAMAGHHLALLRQAGFRPPFLFGGHCNGALVALETARQAEAAGEAVGLVVMVDPISLNARRPLRGLLRALALHSRLRSRKERKRQDRLGRAMARVWTAVESPPWRRQGEPPSAAVESGAEDADAGFERRNAQRLWVYRQAMASYLPRRVAAKLVCLTASRSWPPRFYAAAPWSRFGGDFEVMPLPGGHLTCLTEEAETLAARLRAVLAAF
jgi:acyl-CoA synthetase (AMP-forming)/AMP-acid ligase II/thioesterase domain-containing protein